MDWDFLGWQVSELEGRLLASQKQLEDLQRVQRAFNDHQVQLAPDQSLPQDSVQKLCNIKIDLLFILPQM